MATLNGYDLHIPPLKNGYPKHGVNFIWGPLHPWNYPYLTSSLYTGKRPHMIGFTYANNSIVYDSWEDRTALSAQYIEGPCNYGSANHMPDLTHAEYDWQFGNFAVETEISYYDDTRTKQTKRKAFWLPFLNDSDDAPDPWQHPLIFSTNHEIFGTAKALEAVEATDTTEAIPGQPEIKGVRIDYMYGWLDYSTFIFYVLSCINLDTGKAQEYTFDFYLNHKHPNSSWMHRDIETIVPSERGDIPVHTLFTEPYTSYGESRNYDGMHMLTLHPVNEYGRFKTFADMMLPGTQANIENNYNPIWYETQKFSGPVFVMLSLTAEEDKHYYQDWLKEAIPKLSSFEMRELVNTFRNPTKRYWYGDVTPYYKSPLYSAQDIAISKYDVEAGMYTDITNENFRFEEVCSYQSNRPRWLTFSTTGKFYVTPRNGNYVGDQYYPMCVSFRSDTNPMTSVIYVTEQTQARGYLEYQRQRAGTGWLDTVSGWLCGDIYLLAITAASDPFKFATGMNVGMQPALHREISLGSFHMRLISNGAQSPQSTPLTEFIVYEPNAECFSDVFDTPWTETSMCYSMRNTTKSMLVLFSYSILDRMAVLEWCNQNEHFLKGIQSGMLFRNYDNFTEADPILTYSFPPAAKPSTSENS